MPDILDTYISKIDTSSISKKINDYISKIKLQRNRIIKSSTLQFEILRTKLQLKIATRRSLTSCVVKYVWPLDLNIKLIHNIT